MEGDRAKRGSPFRESARGKGDSRPLVCPRCSHKMRTVAVNTDPFEVNKILGCLKRNHAPPFDKVVTKPS